MHNDATEQGLQDFIERFETNSHRNQAESKPTLMRWGTVKRVDYATKEKRYVPVVAGKRLRVSWTTLTKAQNYAKKILNRYILKLRVHNSGAIKNE